MRTLIAAAAFAMTAHMAAAADVPGNASTTAVLNVDNGVTLVTLDGTDDVDWLRFPIVKGQGYSISNGNGNDDSIAGLKVVDRNGRTIVVPEGCTDNYCQVHFTSPVTTTAYLVVSGSGTNQGDQAQFNTFTFHAVTDCADSLVTLCRGSTDRERHGYFSYAGDHDFYRVGLLKGRTYGLTLRAKSCGGGIGVRVVGSNGRVLLRPVYKEDGGSPTETVLTTRFTAGYTGPFFVDFIQVSDAVGACQGDFYYRIKKLF